MSETQVPDYPTPSTEDFIGAVVEAAVSLIPGAGGALAKLVELVAPSVERRRKAWAKEIGELLGRLQEQQITPEALASDDVWVSAVFEASQAAMGTHVESKRKMLRQLLEGVATRRPRGSEHVLVRRFVRFIEELDEEHFIVLKYASNPGDWYESNNIKRPDTTMGSQRLIMDRAHLGIEDEALGVVLNDLTSRALVISEGLNTTVSQRGLFEPLATPLGDKLLEWVWVPDDGSPT